MGQQYSHLSSDERILIEKLHGEQHLSIRKIAEEIGRDKSTVSRELRRGLWFASNENGSYRPYRPKRLKTGPWTSGPFYSAPAAQRKADRRRREPRKPRRMDSGPLRAWVLDALRRGWSPELIEGRLKAQYAGDPSMRISHECLYRWIHAKPQRAPDLRQYLARGGKSRTGRKGQEGERAAHPDARAHRGPARGGRIQEGVRPFRVGHGGRRRAVEALGMLTYFADPYSSWQRGSNENRNGRIRRYLPKGTSFEDLTQDELDAIVGEINDTPMKLLGYKTPNEVWDEEMAKLQSKQADPKPAVALTS